MPSGKPRHGRRDNGLTAAEYAAVGDVDPRVGEYLLDTLAAAGVAAYLQPAADLDPITRTTTLPSRPADRLYADRRHVATARKLLTQAVADIGDDAAPPEDVPPADDDPPVRDERAVRDSRHRDERPARDGLDRDLPDDPLSDFEATFASIVARFHADLDPPAVRPWPAVEDAPTEEITTEPAPRRDRLADPDEFDEPDDSGSAERGHATSLLDGLDLLGIELPDDDDEGYTPPPPPPLPRISKGAVAGLVSIVGGLLLFFWPGLLPIQPNAALLLGFIAVLGGFVALIWRLRPGGDDDPDDGARV